MPQCDIEISNRQEPGVVPGVVIFRGADT